MPYVVAAVVLVGAVSLLNLVLTTAIIRRMRVYEEEQSRLSGSPDPIPYHLLGGLLPGASLPSFAGTAADGREVTDGDLRGRRAVVAFLSTDCPGCLQQAPQLAAVETEILGADGVSVAVVVEGNQPADALTAALGPTVLVYEPGDNSGPLTQAFEVKRFPTFFILDAAGTVVGRELRAAATAAQAPPVPAIAV